MGNQDLLDLLSLVGIKVYSLHYGVEYLKGTRLGTMV